MRGGWGGGGRGGEGGGGGDGGREAVVSLCGSGVSRAA